MPATITSRRLLPPVIVLLLLVSSLLPARFALLGPPLHNAMHLLLSPVTGGLQSLGARISDRPGPADVRSNEGLRDELLLAEGDRLRLEEENRTLREQLAQLVRFGDGLGEQAYKPVLARVIGRTTSPAGDSMTLNVGHRHGIDVGMVVVDAGPSDQGGAQLVGRVLQVQPSTCTVRPITAPGSQLSLVIGDSREARTLFRATTGQTLVANDAQRGLNVTVGSAARLMDEGGSDPWPPTAQFMLAGVVTRVEPNLNEPLLQEIEVTPIRPLDSLTEVVVLYSDAGGGEP